MQYNNIPLSMFNHYSHALLSIISLSSLLCCLTACERQTPTPPPADAPSTTATPVEKVVIPPEADQAMPPPTLPIQNNPPPPAPPVQSQESIMTPPSQTPPEPTKPPRLTVPSFVQQAPPQDDLYLRFLATAETYYVEIRLENGILNYTYFEDETKRCQQWVKSTPCWQQADLKTISAALTSEELDNLFMVAKESEILQYPHDTAGGAKKGQRFYAQQLDVRIKDKTKRLVYQDFPGAKPKPEAFNRLETALLAYARDLPH